MEHFPHHASTIIPIGASLRSAGAGPLPPEAPLGLLFVGALGIRMNYDALAHFSRRFWPGLRRRFGDQVSVTVAGSNPLPEVRAICAEMGWALKANVSEVDLERLYETASFSILPFSYATGAKLKLLGSLARGVPVLATTSVSPQADLVVEPSLMSDEPENWVARAVEVRRTGINHDVRQRMRHIAEQNSWEASARRLVAILDDA
jgi:glycosyltransferase involved in cell wall biosynthesis